MPRTLFASIADEKNLLSAWEHVRANLGAPGIDRISIEDFEKCFEQELATLQNELLDKAYQPSPYLTFNKAKSSGKPRVLNIPTVRDRIVQQAVLQQIRPICEKRFHDCSYAYRPGRSAVKAVTRIERHLAKGLVWVLNADIRTFFDTIDRMLLHEALVSFLAEDNIIGLIMSCVAALPNDKNQGIPQGMVLAPILSNIYMHRFDDAMIKGAWQYVRFSDNFVILDKLRTGVEEALSRSQAHLKDLKLELNEEKTKVCSLGEGFVFLGYQFDENGKRPSEASRQRLDERLGGALRKAVDLSQDALKEKIEAIIRGWLNYFSLTNRDRQQLVVELQKEFAGQGGSLPQRILQSALAFQLGDKAGARTMLENMPPEPAEDAEINFQWALMCELSGMMKEALDGYLSAVRDNPEHGEAVFRLGLLYLQQNQNEKAIRYLQKAIQLRPQDAAVHFSLATALENFALHGAAKQAYKRAADLDKSIKKWIKLGPTAGQSEELKMEYTEKDTSIFLRLFSGREGVFARQWLSEAGKLGYLPVHHHLSDADVRKHLEGEETLATYMLRADNTVNFMAVDIDVSRQVREEGLSEGSEQNWRDFVWLETSRILSALQDMSLAAYAEDSGQKGMHIWLFFAEPLLAREVRLFAKRLFENIGDAPPGITREIFPKEEKLDKNALGSLIKLPLGIHKMTGQRCLFLNSSGKMISDSIYLLQEVQSISKSTFFARLDGLRAEKAKALPVPEGATETDVLQPLLDRCSVLRYLREKAYEEKMLNHLERLTLLETIGFLGEEGRGALHEIISQTLNYDFRITEKWIRRLKGLPVSCPRMREWHGAITPSMTCNCKFPILDGSYPSPLLHIDPHFIAKLKKTTKPSDQRPIVRQDNASGVEPTGKKLEEEIRLVPAHSIPDPALSDELAALVAHYLKTKKSLSKLSIEIEQIEKKLNGLAERVGQDHFRTQWGVLRRLEIEGKRKWLLEI